MTPLLGPATPRQPARTTRNSVLFLGAPPPAVDCRQCGVDVRVSTRPRDQVNPRQVGALGLPQAGSRRTSDHSANRTFPRPSTRPYAESSEGRRGEGGISTLQS